MVYEKSMKYLSNNFIKLNNKRSVADPQRDWLKKILKKLSINYLIQENLKIEEYLIKMKLLNIMSIFKE